MRARRGIVVEFPTTSPHWNKQVQRAEDDGSGSPVGGTETILETIPGSRTRYADDGAQARFIAGTSYIYRYRFVRVGASDGDWSDWTDPKEPDDLSGQNVPPKDARAIERGDSDNAGSNLDRLADILQNLVNTGQAITEFRRQQTNGTERIMPKQAIPKNNQSDGDGISYSMDAAPQWAPSRHGISYHSELGDVNQAQRYLLEDVTATGATVRAIIQDVGATTTHNHDFLNSPEDPINALNESQLTEAITNLPALNDEFTVRFKWTIFNNGDDSAPFSLTVKIYSVDDSTGTETERDEARIQSTIAGNSSDNGTEERTFTAPDMTDGGNDQFRVEVTAFTGPNGTFEVEGLDSAEDPNPGETHETATTTERDMTQAGIKVGFHLYDPA